jgi:hypothetical protein
LSVDYHVNVINIHMGIPMSALLKLNEWEHPKPIWIAVLLMSLWFSWPVGLVVFAVLMWTGRLEGWKRAGSDVWRKGIGTLCHSGTWWSPQTSGNKAFDTYRSDTLRRLEEEEKEFREFLTRLRAAKDKAEFDQFMTDRRDQRPVQS